MALLFKNGMIITDKSTIIGDLLISGEKITAVGENLKVPGDVETVDASGKLLMPGGIDVHTHFDLPMGGTVSSDDHYTGQKAAAFGGTTTVIDFIPQDKSPLKTNVAFWHKRVDPQAVVDYGFHMNITTFNDEVEKEIPGLLDEGISSLKVFTAYSLRIPDQDIFRVLRTARKHGMLTMLHAENGEVIDLLVAEALAAGYKTPEWHSRTRPAWGAVEAVLRGAALAAMADAPLYIVHMNAAGEVDQLRYARQHGVHVMGETCPQYLFFSEDDLKRPDGAKWVCSPPVRTAADQARLWEGLTDGTIDVLGTDHCPFFFDGRKSIMYEGKPVKIPGKELGEGDFSKIPNGLPGVGDRLPVMWTRGVGTGRITPNQFVGLTSANPARIFGMYPQKGTLAPGSDADIVIWDPNQEVTYGAAIAQHRTDYNLYEGWKLTGYPEKVFLRGKIIVDHGQWLGNRGFGRYIDRKPFTMINND